MKSIFNEKWFKKLCKKTTKKLKKLNKTLDNYAKAWYNIIVKNSGVESPLRAERQSRKGATEKCP